jgi:predicted  nucleic acid-binding Zn-ribbon protein
MNIRSFAFSLALGLLPAAFQLSLAADTPAEKTTAKDVSTKAVETGRAIKDYTVAQRDEAVKQAKAALDDADARIRRMERKIDRDWDKMDQAARKKARETLNALHRERDEAAEWYGGLKHSSVESWEQVKAGFVKSYETLKESFARARKRF